MSTRSTAEAARRRGIVLLALAAPLWLLLAPAFACDVCTTYCPAEAQAGPARSGLQIGFTEQFTYSGALRFGSLDMPNDFGLYLRSSATRFFATYALTEKFEAQLHVPIVYRAFRRFEGADLRKQDLSGLGDVTALVGVRLAHSQTPASAFRLKGLAGFKLPTGSADLLDEPDSDHAHSGRPDVPDLRSAIHSHHVALGTGSLDLVLGADALLSWRSVSFSAAAQGAGPIVARDGFKPGASLNWSASGGIRLYATPRFAASLRANLSGEFKWPDTYAGLEDSYTRMRYVLAGPSLATTWNGLTTELGIGLPVFFDSGGTSIAPDYRIRLGLSWSL